MLLNRKRILHVTIVRVIMYVGDTVWSNASSGCDARALVAKPPAASIYDQGQRYGLLYQTIFVDIGHWLLFLNSLDFLFVPKIRITNIFIKI